MVHSKRLAVLLAMVLSVAGAAVGQMMEQAPRIPGLFKPVLGAGAQYEITPKKGAKSQWAYVVVGKETVQDAEGHWLETRREGGRAGFIMKTLVLMREGKPQLKRMIMQTAGQPPMEMPMEGMMGGMMKKAQDSELGETSLGEKVGTESVTVPAGTYLCDHYRRQVGKNPVDVWISTKVSPYGLVKMSSEDMTIELAKMLESEKSQIKGEPQKLEFPKF